MLTLQRVLYKYHRLLFLSHTVVVAILCLAPIFLLRFFPIETSFFSVYFLLHVLCVVGFCQNIGLVHEFAHRTPFSKNFPFLNWLILLFFHSLGGLRTSMTIFLHLSHHRNLGKPDDPDRNGYTEHTLTRKDRLLYLFFIGPMRKWWAPVDVETGWKKLSEEERLQLSRRNFFECIFLAALHLLLLMILQTTYFHLLFCLILANIFSNLREMTEHGQGQLGKAAYVNMKPGIIGLLFFSTPGFWYHGTHHQHPHIPYWQLPFSSRLPDLIPANRLQIEAVPFLYRSSYFKYLWWGK